MSKSKRIRSKRKHDQEIMRHMLQGNLDKALITINKDPEDNIFGFAMRKVLPMIKKKYLPK